MGHTRRYHTNHSLLGRTMDSHEKKPPVLKASRTPAPSSSSGRAGGYAHSRGLRWECLTTTAEQERHGPLRIPPQGVPPEHRGDKSRGLSCQNHHHRHKYHRPSSPGVPRRLGRQPRAVAHWRCAEAGAVRRVLEGGRPADGPAVLCHRVAPVATCQWRG